MRRLSLEAVQLVSALILSGIPFLYWTISQSYALELTNRSVTVSSAVVSATVSDTFQMTIRSSSDVGSIVFTYCSNSPLPTNPCTPPTGLSLSSATLTAQSGNTGFSFDSADSNANTVVISRVPAPANPVVSAYAFNNITNPSTPNQTTFVRIATYSSSNGVGSPIDNGAVAFSTTSSLQVNAFVPPFLNLCVGLTVSANCSQISGDQIDLGTLSPSATGSASSQFAAATNDPSGYGLYVLGTTMTSGNNVLPPPASPTASRIGTSQFGINLRANSSPPVGSNPSGNGTGSPLPGYNSPNLFSFISGDQIASSPFSTDYNLMTVSYVVNVSPNQPSGVYSTTLTYLAAVQF